MAPKKSGVKSTTAKCYSAKTCRRQNISAAKCQGAKTSTPKSQRSVLKMQSPTQQRKYC